MMEDYRMKKNYTTPKTEWIKVAQMHMICASQTHETPDKTMEVKSDDTDFSWSDVN